MTALYLLLAAVFVLMNGFFVLVEFALVKIRRTKLEELTQEKGSSRAHIALKMHHQMDEYLSATQLGITVASLGLGWIGKPAFAGMFEWLFNATGLWTEAFSVSAAVVTSFVLITFLHVLIGELAPKSIAIRFAEAAILWAAPLMRVFYWIFFIPLTILTQASNAIIRLARLPRTSETETAVTEEELRHVLAHSHRRGEFSLDRLLLMENMLDLSGLTVRQIMVPISQADTLNTSAPWPETYETIRSKRHSRFPIKDGDAGKIIGMLHIKDLALKTLGDVKGLSIQEFRRDVLAIRDSMPLETLLREFQRKRQHLAVVKDSKGNPVGIVTLEDLLEELVGEIVDEFDVGKDSPTVLADYISVQCIDLNLQASDAKDAIRKLLNIFGSTVEIDAEEAFQAVWKREQDAPTGLGKGVAVPHGRLLRLSRPCVAFARCVEGVDFKAFDGVPARLVFLILTPQSAPMMQVKLVARIAGMIQSDYLTTKLMEAASPQEVMGIVRAADVAATL